MIVEKNHLFMHVSIQENAVPGFFFPTYSAKMRELQKLSRKHNQADTKFLKLFSEQSSFQEQYIANLMLRGHSLRGSTRRREQTTRQNDNCTTIYSNNNINNSNFVFTMLTENDSFRSSLLAPSGLLVRSLRHSQAGLGNLLTLRLGALGHSSQR